MLDSWDNCHLGLLSQAGVCVREMNHEVGIVQKPFSLAGGLLPRKPRNDI